MIPNEVRKQYADQIQATTGIRSQALLQAFVKVPREHFLGPGPWQILARAPAGQARSQLMEVSDPRDLYQDVAVVLDQSRNLTNGNPGTLAPWLEALELSAGDSVFHLGCGTGYYSAILAEVVGPGGQVTAIEADPGLAAMARERLSYLAHVEVIYGDGAVLEPGQRDAILINAGVTHPTTAWLDSLKPGGHLLVPLTVEIGVPHVGKGMVLQVARKESGFSARFLPAPIMIFSCTSVRDSDASQLLGRALMSGTMASVQSLRRDNHPVEQHCWLHAPDFCLSTAHVD